MKVDKIFTNGEIYTVDNFYPWADTIAVKDGQFVYVGTAEGAADLEGPIEDLEGRFVMPGIIDSHTHIAWSSGLLIDIPGVFIQGESKEEILSEIRKNIAENPDSKDYKFYINVACLCGEKLYRNELDELCPDKPLLIVEAEQHSRWLNSLRMKVDGIDDFTPDIAPGLSYCERDNEDRINGRIFEFNGLASNNVFPKNVFEDGLDIVLDCWKKWGVVAAFDAGQPANDVSINNFFDAITERENRGELPVYIEGCFYFYDPKHLEYAIKKLKEHNSKYHTDHFRVRTMKIMLDGTPNGHTAAQFENYADEPSNGGTLLDTETLKNFILDLNLEGIDLHIHTVGERAVATVLDAVESAKAELQAELNIQVTCAHIETIRPEHIGRFAKLGVLANFTPHWNGGNCYESHEALVALIGEKRARHTNRANSIWNTGALVCFSSDDVTFDNMKTWSPYVGFEVGITHQDNKFDNPIEDDFSKYPAFPSNTEKLSLAQMIKGYTINGAKQMRLDNRIGSIEVGKDASFLVFEKSLFEVDIYELHKQLPKQVYIQGELQK